MKNNLTNDLATFVGGQKSLVIRKDIAVELEKRLDHYDLSEVSAMLTVFNVSGPVGHIYGSFSTECYAG